MKKKTASRIRAAMKPSARSAEDQLEEIRKILDEVDDAEAEGETEETEAEGETDETTAEGETEETEAEGEEDETTAEGEEEKVDAKKASAILDLPEAKGREALAKKLAFTPGMKVATAKDLLAAAPRASGSRLNAVPDPKLGAGGQASAVTKTEDEKAAQFILDSAALASGRPTKR